MKDMSASRKIGEEFETMISIKTTTFEDGKTKTQLSFSPKMQKEIYAWIKSQDGSYFNMNLKVWGEKPQAQDTTK